MYVHTVLIHLSVMKHIQATGWHGSFIGIQIIHDNYPLAEDFFNPFPPSVTIWHRLEKLSILILEGIIKKISYERRDYESVDEKSLS